MEAEHMGAYIPGLVSIIIPTLTRKKSESIQTLLRPRYLFKDCIEDCRRNIACPFEIVVVCNSPDDKELVHYITSGNGIDKYCINSVNVGVPRSWNMGAALAQGEFLCFVNDDVEIGRGAVETLKNVLQTDASAGEVGPAGGKWHRRQPGERVGRKVVEEADEISGWLFMVRRTVFDAVGGVDIAYTPALCEEIDLSFAIRKAGYSCLVVPGIDARHHHISGASSTNRPIQALDMQWERTALTARNRSYFEKKWSAFWEDAK